MSDYHLPLFPGEQYHILSRAVGDEKIFRREANYHFFLSRYWKYILPVADTYSYCLIPNHFHVFVKIKSLNELLTHFQQAKNKLFPPDKLPDLIMQQFSNLLNSYTKSLNKMYKRKGGLFIDRMRRVPVTSKDQFDATVFYIHKNPVHHGICRRMEDWKWSSYASLLSDQPTALLRAEVLESFGGLNGFREYHNRPIYIKGSDNLE